MPASNAEAERAFFLSVKIYFNHEKSKFQPLNHSLEIILTFIQNVSQLKSKNINMQKSKKMERAEHWK